MIRRALGKLLGCGCESQEAELDALRSELGTLRRQVDDLQAALRRAAPTAAVGSFAEAAQAMARGQHVQLGASPATQAPAPAVAAEAPAGVLFVELEGCIACGTCVEYCAAAFELGADGRAVVISNDAPAADVKAAMDACPTQCIIWER